MAWFAFVIQLAMSMSSIKSKKMYEPRYLNCAVKLMKEPLLSISILLVLGEFQ